VSRIPDGPSAPVRQPTASYNRVADLFGVIGLVAVTVMVLALVQLVRFAVRFMRDEEEMQPGGSYGRQLGRRSEKPGRPGSADTR
jgi:hypothetical protein